MINDWFRHDYNAHDDIKQKRLLKTIGLAGLGLYWYLVELIYQHGGQMSDADIRLESELVDGAGLLDSLQSLGLLSCVNGIWTCRRIKDELDFRDMQKQKKSQAGRKGMASRWGDNNVITPDNSVITDDNSVITPYNTPITPDNTTITNDNTLPYPTLPNIPLSVSKETSSPSFDEKVGMTLIWDENKQCQFITEQGTVCGRRASYLINGKRYCNQHSKIFTTKALNYGIPYTEIQNAWNEKCLTSGLPKCTKISDKRRKSIKTLWIEFKEDVYKAINKVAESDFLSGRDGKWTGCCFDWLFTKNNMLKVLEGNYDNKDMEKNAPVKRKDYSDISIEGLTGEMDWD